MPYRKLYRTRYLLQALRVFFYLGEGRSRSESPFASPGGGYSECDTDNLGIHLKKPTLDLRGVFSGAEARDGIGGASEALLWGWSCDCLSGRGGGPSPLIGSPFSTRKIRKEEQLIPWAENMNTKVCPRNKMYCTVTWVWYHGCFAIKTSFCYDHLWLVPRLVSISFIWYNFLILYLLH